MTCGLRHGVVRPETLTRQIKALRRDVLVQYPFGFAERHKPAFWSHVIAQRELAVGVGLELAQRRRVGAHANLILRRRELENSQPAVAAVGSFLIVRKQRVHGIAVEDVRALALFRAVAAEHHEQIGVALMT
jgi:hypothetical protein